MKRIIRRAIRKLENEFDGGYVGYVTPQDLLHLADIGLTLKHNHKCIMESAKMEKSKGICYSRWHYFTKPKKELVKIIENLLANI